MCLSRFALHASSALSHSPVSVPRRTASPEEMFLSKSLCELWICQGNSTCARSLHIRLRSALLAVVLVDQGRGDVARSQLYKAMLEASRNTITFL